MYDVENISLKTTLHENGSNQVDIESPNGLIYTIIDNLPDNTKTYLKLTHQSRLIFDFSIEKFIQDAVFDTEYFKQTQYHYLFRMDNKSLKQFLKATNNDISLIYSYKPEPISYENYYEHYLLIDDVVYRLNACKRTVKKNGSYVRYIYNSTEDSLLNRIVKNHSVEQLTTNGYRRSHYAEYSIVGDHFQLYGVYNGPFYDLFSLRYSPKTLDLHINNFKHEKTHLTNQSVDDLNAIFKKELFDWLAADGDESIKKALTDFDFDNTNLKDSLKLLEMAVI